jgi:hypothetical protein
MLRARARRAQPEDIHDVVRLGETMLGGNVFCPLFDGIRLDFDCCAALTANQMVVVRVRRAGTKQALPVLLQGVGVTSSGKVCQCPIDGRKSNRASRVSKCTV